MPLALVALGSNQGPRVQLLQQARAWLSSRRSLHPQGASRVWLTRPVGGPAKQPQFANQVLLFRAECSPLELLELLQQCEAQLGRKRQQLWGPRTLDADLLLYGQEVIQTPRLLVPHPRMSFRRFVLQPAVEVAPRMIHPVAGMYLQHLLRQLDQSEQVLVLWPGRQIWQALRKAASQSSERLVRLGPWQLKLAGEKDSAPWDPNTWEVFFGEEELASDQLPRARLAAIWSAQEVAAGEVLSVPEEAQAKEVIRQVGPHLVFCSLEPSLLVRELAAALEATGPETMMGILEHTGKDQVH